MPKLTAIIPQQNFELIRDRIGLIIADEMAGQFAFHGDASITPKAVYIERAGVDFDLTEVPCINVMLIKGDYTSEDAVSADGNYEFAIDCYTSAPFSASTIGDVTARVRLHRMAGMVRAILSNPAYRTLDFVPPSLSRVSVSGIQIGEMDSKDSTNQAFGRITLEVIAQEGVELPDGLDLTISSTTVKLYKTKQGYFYDVAGTDGNRFVDQEGTPFVTQDRISTFKPLPE